MWPRVVEVMLGCWLLMGPFLFGHGADRPALWVNDLGAGSAVIVLALLSWWRPLRHAHVATLAVALWLIGFTYAHSGESAAPAQQSNATIGFLLAMFSVLPNGASDPPQTWRRASVQRTPAEQ